MQLWQLELKHLFLLLTFGLTAPLILPAQYDWNNPSLSLTIEDGLPSHYFRGMAKNKEGFMWIGTFSGLCRFDGRQVQSFLHKPDDSTTISTDGIMTLASAGKDQKLMAGTYYGLNVYEPVSAQFISYTHIAGDTCSIPNNFVYRIYNDRQDDIWVGTSSNVLAKFDEKTGCFKWYFPEGDQEELVVGKAASRVRAISQDYYNDSLLWVSTNEKFFCFNKYTETFTVPDSTLRIVDYIHPHADGHLYIYSGANQIKRFDTKTRKMVDWLKLEENWNIRKIFKKSEKELWITSNLGLSVLNTETFTITKSWANHPKSKKYYDIDYIDEQGRIWAATPNGINVYDPLTTQFANYHFELSRENLPCITMDLVEDTFRNVLYLAVESGDGLYCFDLDTKEWTIIPPPSNYRGDAFSGRDVLITNTGRIIIVESNNLYTLTSDGRQMKQMEPLPGLKKESNWYSLFEDHAGYIWMAGFKNGWIKWHPEKQTIENISDKFQPCSGTRLRPVFLQDSRKNVWMSNCGGITVYSYERDTFYNFPCEEDQDCPNSFYRTKGLVEDDQGRIWMGEASKVGLGLANVEQPELGITKKIALDTLIASDSFQIKKGFAQDFAITYPFVKDKQGYIWLISKAGLLRMDQAFKSLEIFSDNDGLELLDPDLNVFTLMGLIQLSDGQIVMGFRKGVGFFRPEQLRYNQELPRPYLTSLKVFNEELLTDSSLYFAKDIYLDYTQNFFSLEFSSIGFTHPEKNFYQYQLEGVDPSWTDAGQRNYVGYTNIDGGDYTFKVKAANVDGMWNKEPLKIRLHISTPWWKTAWFRTFVLLGILASIFAFYQYRINRLMKEERLRSQYEKKLANVELTALRAQMNPHFIFNCLNSIDHYIIKNETRKASEYLNSFSRLIRLILQNSRSNYINLKDELEALKLYMEMESLRFNHRFDYVVQVEKEMDLESTEIPPMIIQPYVENAIWHGLMHKKGKGKVVLTLGRENGYLHCSIEDNGIGRDKAAQLKSKNRTRKKSMGMGITKDRINIINNLYNTDTSVHVIDLKDKQGIGVGTRIELTIPI